MQIAKLQQAVDSLPGTNESMPAFLRRLSFKMTEESGRSPSVVRAILQANLSSSIVRSAMRVSHTRAHGLLTRLVQAGQKRGEFRRDVSAKELAHVFRQTVFGTLLDELPSHPR